MKNTTRTLTHQIFIALCLCVFVVSVVCADNSLPKELENVGIQQKLNSQLPLDLKFKDENGKRVILSDYFGRKPIILTFAYFDCPMLCSYVLGGTASALKVVNFNIGKEFDVLTISFDPSDTPAKASAQKAKYVGDYRRAGAENGWHFLTSDSETIRKITQAAGFKYQYDAETKQFAHASGIMVVTPQGKLARYFYGVEFSPRDLRLALVEASQNKIGSAVDQLLLFCYHYDPTTGKYGAVALNLIRLGGIVTVVALGTFVVIMKRKEQHV